MSYVSNARIAPIRRCLLGLGVTALIAASCGGTEPPRIAIQLPREATGPSNSPAIQAAFAIQDQLDLPTSQSTMQTYLGNRYAGDWIINNGKTGILYVGAVHLVNADERYARGHVHMGPDASVKLVNEKYSMTQLNAFDAIVSKYVEDHAKGKVLSEHPFVGFGVSQPDNAVRFVVSRRDSGFWLPRIQPLLPYDALVVEYSSERAATALHLVEGGRARHPLPEVLP
jgi:hypothetical protein